MGEKSSDTVITKLKAIFPNEDTETILSLFRSNGVNDERTQLAVIKLSMGKFSKLEYFIDAAKVDWRDVLAWAEYPEELKNPTWNMDVEEVKSIRARGRRQYLNWLNQK